MSHAALSAVRIQADLARLDGLISNLNHVDSNQLLLEHLHSAHTYLLGAMPNEYAASLKDARGAANGVAQKALRTNLQDGINYLLTEISHARRPQETERQHCTHRKQHHPASVGGKSPLWDFFSGSDISFGTFYPKRHIVAIFPTFDLAKQAEASLVQSGFSGQEILAIPGNEMLRFLAEIRMRAGLWGNLLARLSHNLGTEETFVENDVRRAQRGAAFLAIYSPADEESEFVCQQLVPFRPSAIQRYLTFGIQSLI